jgi:hypothetical protein
MIYKVVNEDIQRVILRVTEISVSDGNGQSRDSESGGKLSEEERIC